MSKPAVSFVPSFSFILYWVHGSSVGDSKRIMACLSQVARSLQVQGAAHLRHCQRHLLQPTRECARRLLAAFSVPASSNCVSTTPWEAARVSCKAHVQPGFDQLDR